MEKITAKREAITGNILNQSSAVDINESMGRKLLLPFILNCIQKIDNGYKIFVKTIKKGYKLPFCE